MPTLDRDGVQIAYDVLAAAGYMTTAICHAEKVLVPGAGHAANIDQPSAFNDAVVDFLARHCLDIQVLGGELPGRRMGPLGLQAHPYLA